MRPFLYNTKFSISLLSPVHIGCNEDYTPFNSTITAEDNTSKLIYFGPINNKLTQNESREIESISNLPVLLNAYSKKAKNLIEETGHEIHSVNTSRGVVDKYDAAIKHIQSLSENATAALKQNSPAEVINQLTIPRTTYHLHTQQPYICGSSIKGAIRTGLLNTMAKATPKSKLNLHHDERGIENKLLAANHKGHLFHALRPSDCAPSNEASLNAATTILFSKNVNRFEEKKAALSLALETITHDKNIEFVGSISLQHFTGARFTPASSNESLLTQWHELISDCNKYYMNVLKQEITRYKIKGILNKEWINRVESVLDSLTPNQLLLRIGKYCGAESITIEGHRSIAPIKNSKNRSNRTHVATDWLAADNTDQKENFIPFGWILISFNE